MTNTPDTYAMKFRIFRYRFLVNKLFEMIIRYVYLKEEVCQSGLFVPLCVRLHAFVCLCVHLYEATFDTLESCRVI